MIRHLPRIGFPLARAWWFIRRPKKYGSKILVENNGKFLLVKISYAHKSWTIPGGGMKRGESAEEAALREIQEEADINLTGVTKIGEYKSNLYHTKDTVYCFYAETSSDYLEPDGVEILEAKWFSRDELPDGYMPVVDYLFEMYDKYKRK